MLEQPSDRPAVTFAVAVKRSWRHWLPAMVLVAVATFSLAIVARPMPLVHAAVALVTGLVGVPLLFTLALAASTAVLSLLLALLAGPSLVVGRPTGLSAALESLWSLPRGILPGYWLALRRVRRPGLWGGLLGLTVGAGLAVAAVGFGERG
jgi:hypothetical protein